MKLFNGKPVLQEYLRNPRGQRVGVAVALPLDETSFGINWSLVNPGVHGKKKRIINKDKFDQKLGVFSAVGKVILGAPRIKLKHETVRGAEINAQLEDFITRAKSYFADKTMVEIPAE